MVGERVPPRCDSIVSSRAGVPGEPDVGSLGWRVVILNPAGEPARCFIAPHAWLSPLTLRT